jgi:hypothetical protein
VSTRTPGPWRVGRKVGRTIYCEEAGTDGRLIGVMDRREDAQLAAAAPELLEAARNAEVLIDSGSPHSLDEASRVLRAAIVKATGGES